MTLHNIFLNMSAGREMDALVAEKVMDVSGVRLSREVWTGCIDGQRNVILHYSTDIKDAWEIVKKLISESFDVTIESVNLATGIDWFASISNDDFAIRASAQTAPLAICRAALAAYEKAKVESRE